MSVLTSVHMAFRGLALLTMLAAAPSAAQYADDQPGAGSSNPRQLGVENKYLKVPLVSNIPGGIAVQTRVTNPMAGDPSSVQRGMQYFTGFNCVGCHAPNGGGGMGPSLSNRAFKFGGEPAQHFVVIAHGAPLGMPAWAELLPENVIWDLVSYIDSISSAPSDRWGTTFSPTANLPRIEQVPAELNPTAKPWGATQPFSGGKAPHQ